MIEIVMPKLGLTMDEGTIKQWLKKEGDMVEAGEEILEVEGDKTSSMVEAPGAGTLGRILFPNEGDVVPVTKPVAYILEEGETYTEVSEETAAVEVEEESTAGNQAETSAVRSIAPAETERGRRKISPLARKYAQENGIDLDQVSCDESGVVHIKQVKEYKDSAPKIKATPMARAIAAEKGVELSAIEAPEGGRIYKDQVEGVNEAPAAAPAQPKADGDVEVPFRGMTKTIAKRMTQSKQSVPHYYLTISCDMTNANQVIKNIGCKVSFHDYLARVLATALKEHPEINAHVYEDRMILKKDINVGVAVAVDNGLIVPVIREVQSKSLGQIAGESRELIRKARDGQLQPDDYQGGTITISNLGMFGIDEFSAIINQPEAAIIAVGRTTETPVVVDGEVVVRQICRMTASFDHRAVNGAEGAKFLKRVKELIENPIMLI